MVKQDYWFDRWGRHAEDRPLLVMSHNDNVSTDDNNVVPAWLSLLFTPRFTRFAQFVVVAVCIIDLLVFPCSALFITISVLFP